MVNEVPSEMKKRIVQLKVLFESVVSFFVTILISPPSVPRQTSFE